MFYGESHSPSIWAKFLKLNEQERLSQLKTLAGGFVDDHVLEEEKGGGNGWSWTGYLNSLFFGDKNEGNKEEERKKWRTGKSPDSYNLYDRKPDFSNAYGWSIALDGEDYAPLQDSGIGLYLVNLTAVVIQS